MAAANKTLRITEFDGLRGILAWWVVSSHILHNSGFGASPDANILFKLLREGSYAVDVFIILSGFVIFHLLDHRREKYGIFITRRFFRIYPVYIICFAVSLLYSDMVIHNLQSLPWSSELESYISRIKQEQHDIWKHVIAHITMLHGIFPNQILPNSTTAFLTPAWSISLEWQFYLVAPFVFMVLRRSKISFFVLTLVILLFNKYAYLAGKYNTPAFLPLKSELFWLGGVCYYIFKVGSEDRGLSSLIQWVYFIGGISCLALVFFFKASLLVSLTVWFVSFGAVLMKYSSRQYKSNSGITHVLNCGYLQKLGAMSYSTYLVHVLVIYGIQWGILKIYAAPGKYGMLLMLTIVTVPAIILISSMLHRIVEKPFMKVGSTIALKWRSDSIRNPLFGRQE